MSALNGGGAAFPDPGRAQSAKQREKLTSTGMTLRDYFAAKALVTIAAYPSRDVEMWEPYDFARHAYQIADAMLAERESGQVRVVPKEAYDQCNTELAKAENLLEAIGYRYKGKGEWEAPAAKVQP